MAQLINEAKRLQKLAGLITESQFLLEGVKLDVLIKDGKPNSEALVVPNKFYANEEELKANSMRPLQIKKEEGRKDMMIFTVVGSKSDNKEFPIEGDEVANVILYDEAKKKLRESQPTEANESVDTESTVNEGLPMGKSKPAQDAANALNSIVSKIEMPNLSQEARVAASKIISLIDQDQTSNMEESTDIESAVNEALAKVRKSK